MVFWVEDGGVLRGGDVGVGVGVAAGVVVVGVFELGVEVAILEFALRFVFGFDSLVVEILVQVSRGVA